MRRAQSPQKAYAFFQDRAQSEADIRSCAAREAGMKRLELMVAQALVDHAFVDTQRYLESKERLAGQQDKLFPIYFVKDILQRLGGQVCLAFPGEVQAYEHGYGAYGFSLYRFESPKTHQDFASVMFQVDPVTNEMIVAKALTPPDAIPAQAEVIARFGHQDRMLYAKSGQKPDETADIDEQVRRIVNYVAPALPASKTKRQFLEGFFARRNALKLAC